MPSIIIGREFKQRKSARHFIERHRLIHFKVVKVPGGYMALKVSAHNPEHAAEIFIKNN